MPEFKEIDEPEERKRLGLDINRKVGMQLDKKWFWKNRVLDCRVRVESGNPAGDDLRERLAALTGVPLADILAQMKKDKQEAEKKAKGTITDYEKEKKFKEVLKRTHVAGAASLSLEKMTKLEIAEMEDKSKKNLNKGKKFMRSFNLSINYSPLLCKLLHHTYHFNTQSHHFVFFLTSII